MHTFVERTALILIVLLWGVTGCRSSDATATAEAPHSSSARREGDMSDEGVDMLDATHAAEAWNLLAAQGETVWPDWGKRLPPLLFRKGEFDFLIGHPNPPAGFEPMADVTVRNQQVYRQEGHLTPRPVATAWLVEQTWCVALPTLEAFRQAVVELLGPDAVQLDDASFVRTITHEAFHAHQMRVMGGMEGLPDFVQAVDEKQALEILAKQPDLDDHLAALGETLRAGIQAETDAEARQAAEEFLTLRQGWRTDQPPEVALFEQSTEWLEGLARYADTRLLILAGQPDYADASLLVQEGIIDAYPEPEQTWSQFLEQLADPASIPGNLRDRYYVIGAGQAFLLDRLAPQWQAQALPGGTALEQLLTQAVSE